MIIEEKAIKPFEIALFGKSEVKKKKKKTPTNATFCLIVSSVVVKPGSVGRGYPAPPPPLFLLLTVEGTAPRAGLAKTFPTSSKSHSTTLRPTYFLQEVLDTSH